MDSTQACHHLAAALRTASMRGASMFATSPPARITVREASVWLGVTQPTAGKLLRQERAILRASAPTLPITALAQLARPHTARATPLRIVVAGSPASAWASAIVAAGLAQGLGILGRAVDLIDDPEEAVFVQWPTIAWPNLAWAVAPGQIYEHVRTPWASIELASAVRSRRQHQLAAANLVLVPCPSGGPGMRACASLVEECEVKPGVDVRVLLYGDKPAVAHSALIWRGLPDLDQAQRSGCPIPPLVAAVSSRAPRIAMQVRAAMARLCWAVAQLE